MAGLANYETDGIVADFIASIQSASKQADSLRLIDLITEITGYKPKVWGNDQVKHSFIGFGNYSYKRKGGNKEYHWFYIGFAPRKAKITLYFTYDVSEEKEWLKDLGKYKLGKGCLYFNKLADLNEAVLVEMIRKSCLPMNG